MNVQLVQANDLYKKAVSGAEGLGRRKVTRISYLHRALEIYGTELRKLPEGPGRLSVQRNIAMAHYRLSEVMGSTPKDLVLTLYHAREALQGLTGVWLGKAQRERDGDWGGKVEEHVLDCFRNVCRAVDLACEPGTLDKYHYLDGLLRLFRTKGLKGFLLQLTQCRAIQFHLTGIRALERQDFKKALRLVEYGKTEVWKLRSLQRGSQGVRLVILEEDIDSLEGDLEFLRFSCESVQLRFQADELFQICISQLEELNMNLVWDVLDRYKAACLVARDRDIENEAIAVSRIGRLYHKVFKLTYKAKEYYRVAFDLGMSMQPRDLSSADWFKETKKTLEELQRNVVQEEAERKAKEREPFVEKLKVPLEKLKEASLGTSFELLDYVYKTHPPRATFTYDKAQVNHDNVKKTLMIAITRYHPDKQGAEDMEWKVLSEEITKYLTAKYETLKGD